jgi:ankyrin repeat protein
MSQAAIDAFVASAARSKLTPDGVTTAVVTMGIPVNGRDSSTSSTALHFAVANQRRELVVALLAAGADANVKDDGGWTSLWWAAYTSTADILQLLIDSGGSVNEPDDEGITPLIILVKWSDGDSADRLHLLLAQPELDLDAKSEGQTAEEWAEEEDHPELAQAIAAERTRRARWDGLRFVWVTATVTPSI